MYVRFFGLTIRPTDKRRLDLVDNCSFMHDHFREWSQFFGSTPSLHLACWSSLSLSRKDPLVNVSMSSVDICDL